jgi:hypothetical protein
VMTCQRMSYSSRGHDEERRSFLWISNSTP